jgi:hypothetical protein
MRCVWRGCEKALLGTKDRFFCNSLASSSYSLLIIKLRKCVFEGAFEVKVRKQSKPQLSK